MRGSIRRSTGVGAAALLGGLVLAASAVAVTTYADPTGDATGGAPDLAQVIVSNDITGLITFRITTVEPLVSGSLITVDLDTDLSPANGAEYAVLVGVGGAGLVRWDGKAYVEVAAVILMTRSGNVVELQVKRGDVGDATRFGFAAGSLVFDDSNKIVGSDAAPDGGEFTYALTFPQCSNGKDDDGDGRIDADDFGCSSQTDTLESDDPVTLEIGPVAVVPVKPKAGKTVVVTALVTRVETDVGIPAGTVRCAGRAGKTALRGVGRVAGGRASCAFRLPTAAKGRRCAGSITVTHLGKRKVVPFSFRVQ